VIHDVWPGGALGPTAIPDDALCVVFSGRYATPADRGRHGTHLCGEQPVVYKSAVKPDGEFDYRCELHRPRRR
jgi:hypothetical protein